MKIAVTGANGQLGTDILKTFKELDVVGLTHADIEITNRKCTRDVLFAINPSVIIHTAAFVRVDECEDEPDMAFRVNAIGTKNVAEVASELNALLIYISTDYVFDGEKGAPYTEDDCPNPINTYGITKLAGEYFAQLVDKWYVIRVASLFGTAGASGKGGNFIEAIFKQAATNNRVDVVADMMVSPTYTWEAAQVMSRMLKIGLPSGVYHLANSGTCTWYDFAQHAFELAGTDVDLRAIATATLSQKAKRPCSSVLVSNKLSNYGLSLGDWESALKHYLGEKRRLKGRKNKGRL